MTDVYDPVASSDQPPPDSVTSNDQPAPGRRRFLGLLAAATGAAAASGTTEASVAVNDGWKRGDPAYRGQQGRRWAMLIDLRKCVGCQACTVACKIENKVPEYHFRTWVPDVELGTGTDARRAFLPRLCNHCQRPSCINVCPSGATWQRVDGVVEIDFEVCWGCGSCIDACPYDARFFNPQTKTAEKCTFCSHRIDRGLLPACVETCVGGARQFGDLLNPDSPVAKAVRTEPVQVLKPASGNEPRVFYIGLNNTLQNNLPGRPTTWSEDRKIVDPDADEEWTITALEVEHD